MEKKNNKKPKKLKKRKKCFLFFQTPENKVVFLITLKKANKKGKRYQKDKQRI